MKIERPWTPGPWETYEAMDVYCVIGKSPWTVSYVKHQAVNESGWKPVNQSKSDACLIASAPCLFDALERLIGYVDSPCGGCGENNAPPEVIAQAKAVIAKATGGKP